MGIWMVAGPHPRPLALIAGRALDLHQLGHLRLVEGWPHLLFVHGRLAWFRHAAPCQSG